MSARWRLYFPKVVIHFGAGALLALLLQLLAIFGPFGGADLPRRILLIASYVVLLAFVVVNLRRPGLAVLGVGLLLNFAVIVANGGRMPITPETFRRTEDLPADIAVGDWIPHSKDTLLDREDVRLWDLSDRLVWPNVAGTVRAFSPGDLIIGLGLVITLGELFLPRLQRAPAGGPESRDGSG